MKIFGEMHERRAEVDSRSTATRRTPTATSSAPGSAGSGGPIKRAFVVHGEAPALGAMANLLREEGVREVHVPEQGDTYTL